MRTLRSQTKATPLVSVDLVAVMVLLLVGEMSLRAVSSDLSSLYSSLALFSLIVTAPKRARSQYLCLILCLPLVLLPSNPSWILTSILVGTLDCCILR
jgi:hypothetical protein